ncbi:MAG: hypothetical protein ACYTGA_10895 [Planctomycetota bacterium]|jgi:hypothetical protein
MRLFCHITAILLLGSLLGGCTGIKENHTVHRHGLKVNIVDGDQFPEYLVGTWRQEHREMHREFVFTPDGYLESAVIAMGSTRMYPNHPTEKPLIDGGEAVFVPGKWDATLSLNDRELGVEINVESFKMQVRDQILEGKMKEYFIGTISDDGLRWETSLVSLPEYYATTDEMGGTKTLMSGDEVVEEGITFYKVLPEAQEE